MTRVRAVNWSPSAQQDLRDIWGYYDEVASETVADRMVREISRHADRIGQNPMPGRTRNELRSGLMSLLAKPYAIFFRLKGDSIEISRVLHESRDFSSALKGDAD